MQQMDVFPSQGFVSEYEKQRRHNEKYERIGTTYMWVTILFGAMIIAVGMCTDCCLPSNRIPVGVMICSVFGVAALFTIWMMLRSYAKRR